MGRPLLLVRLGIILSAAVMLFMMIGHSHS
jgi:hypothetical protein